MKWQSIACAARRLLDDERGSETLEAALVLGMLVVVIMSGGGRFSESLAARWAAIRDAL